MQPGGVAAVTVVTDPDAVFPVHLIDKHDAAQVVNVFLRNADLEKILHDAFLIGAAVGPREDGLAHGLVAVGGAYMLV